jgi:hypothetical protein
LRPFAAPFDTSSAKQNMLRGKGSAARMTTIPVYEVDVNIKT